MNAPTERTIPHDIGAERAILGAVFLSPENLHTAISLNVVTESFYREPHRLLWEVFCEVDRSEVEIDIVTIVGCLDRRGKLDSIGGPSWLAGLANDCPMQSNLGHYIHAVMTMARSRALLTAASQAQYDLFSGADVDEVSGDLQHAILEGSPKPDSCSVEADTAWAVVERIRRGQSGARALPTGFEDLDDHGRIFIRGKVMIVVGDSGMGKSALVDQICKSAAKGGHPGCLFGMEMEREEYSERRIANEGHINYRSIQEGRLTDEEMAAMMDAQDVLVNLPIWTDDELIDMRKVEARTAAGVRRDKWEWVAIDHAHIVPPTDDSMSEAQTIAEVAKYGMRIGKRHGVAVIIAVQMNADIKKRENKRPQTGDIKYGGPLVQAASSIITLYRDEVYNPDTTATGVAEVAIKKARFGRLGLMRLRWHGQFQRFDRYAPAGGGW